MGKFLSVCTSSDSSVDQSGSPSITSSPSADNQSKFPSNHGEKNAVNYLHEILVEILTASTLSVPSVVAPICALSVLSIHLSDDEHQEIPDEFHGTNYERKINPK